MNCPDVFLKADKIHVALGGRPVLKNISLELRKGEMLGLIGPNGSGKSTLVKTLLGLLPAQSGEVALNGVPLEKIKLKERARQMAYMPQGSQITWPLSVKKIVTLGRIPHLSPWQKLSPPDHDAIEKAMNLTDVLPLAERSVTELAGGEKTLVMMARALCVESGIMLADEPVAGLDPGHQLQVMELLRKLADQGKSVLVVLHDLTLAARFCHRLVLLQNGQVAAEGSSSQVLSPENLRRVYGIQAKTACHDDVFYVLPWTRLT